MSEIIRYSPQELARYAQEADALVELISHEQGNLRIHETNRTFSIAGVAPNPSRRLLLRGVLAGAAGLALVGIFGHAEANGSQVAQASEVVIPTGRRPWTSPHWFPANGGHPGLKSMADALDEGGFHQAAQWHRQYVRYENRSDAGECPALAAAGQLEDAPSDTGNAAKVGVLSELHRGVVALQIVNPRERVIQLLQGGNMIAVDAPTGNLDEIWVRAAYGFTPDGSKIAATAFGAEGVEPSTFPISAIKRAWVLIQYNDRRAQAPNVDPVFTRVRNPHLDPENPAHVAVARNFARA